MIKKLIFFKFTVPLWLKSKYFWEDKYSRFCLIVAALELGLAIASLSHLRLFGLFYLVFCIYFIFCSWRTYTYSEEFFMEAEKFLKDTLDKLKMDAEKTLKDIEDLENDERGSL